MTSTVQVPTCKTEVGDPKQSRVGTREGVASPCAPYTTPIPPRPGSEGPCQPSLPGLGRGQASHSDSRGPRERPR